MPCYSPLQAWRGSVASSGKRSIVFQKSQAKVAASEISLPCGQCIGCRLERSRQWAMRCLHESECWKDNCFITLTYSDDNLPRDGSLPKYQGGDFQLFMKRLRKEFGNGVRFFHCGEYGEKLGRPHYHACLFNCDFSDKVLWSVRNGCRLYVSDTLNRLWGLGHAVIGDVTFESAAYVARYICKKVTGEEAVSHYDGRRPEYVTMSRRPGIGKTWFDRFKSDVYPSDYVVVRGQKMRPPKYYDGQYEISDKSSFDVLKDKRKRGVRHLVPLIDRLAGKADFVREATPDRLVVKEFVKRQAVKSLRRSMEEI